MWGSCEPDFFVQIFNDNFAFLNQDHGSGVERYREMARVAVSGRFSGGFKGNLAILVFDLRLAWDWVKMGFMKIGFKVALSLGYIPDLLEDLENKQKF